MTAVNLTSYDEVSYPSYAYPQTHPDRLATIATLLGMHPTPIDACRVLEIGCGAGGNILPMAFALPGSTFVGIDLAGAAITEGRGVIQTLGLKNVSLEQLDVMAISSELGPFDYIIAHGVYSWVSEVVRDRILSICRSHLTPQGVAYISYNAYPGSRLREIVRDIMLFHSKDTDNITEIVEQGRGVIKWIAEAHKEQNSYATFMAEMNTRLSKRGLGAIYHDELSADFAPFYFYQFARDASHHGLRFLAEADFFESTATTNLVAETVKQLDQLGEEDTLAREQYLDFLKGRSFRQTLLCHQEVSLKRPIESAQLRNLLIKSQVEVVSPSPDLHSNIAEEFRGPKGAAATTDQPLAKATLVYLSQIYPRAVSFGDLLTNASRLAGLGSPNDETAEMLANILISTYCVDLIELHVHEPVYASVPGSRPVASPLARYQIQHDNVVTTVFHNSMRLEGDLACHLLTLLDGTRDRPALIHELRHTIESNASSDEAQKKALLDNLPQELEARLVELAKLGLLLE